MDPAVVGGIVGAGANLVGGIMGQRNQAAINTANINAAQNAAMYGIEWRVADAKRAGINPLAALGSNFQPGAPQSVGSNALGAGIGAAGQDLARAMQAYGDKISKQAQLDIQYKQAMIDQVNATTAGEMLRNSQLAKLTQPGTPPSMPTSKPKTLFEDYVDRGGGKLTLLSHDASQAVMNAASLPAAIPIGMGLIGENLKNMYNFYVPSGVARTIRNLGTNFVSPDMSQYVPF